MSKQSLSKGTLGLKFMNRTVPPSAPPAAVPSSSSSTPQPPPTQAKSQNGISTTSQAAKSVSKNPTSGTAPRQIIHDSSLLSFPILSSSSSSSFSSSNLYYNSMPLTSTAISGRRSFGGANIEIERLNDPSSHQTPPAGSKDKEKDSRKTDKKTKKQRREEPVSTRRTDAPSSSKRSANSQKPTVKKRRISEEGEAEKIEMSSKWKGGEEASASFKRPAGFEGAKTMTQKGSKGKGKGLMDLEQHKWAAKGTTREWDQSKPTREEFELGSSEDDRRILEGLDDDQDDEDEEDSESEEESEDDEEEIRKMLMSAKALDQKRSTPARGSGAGKEYVEKEVRRMEGGRMMGESSKAGSESNSKKRNKKGRK